MVVEGWVRKPSLSTHILFKQPQRKWRQASEQLGDRKRRGEVSGRGEGREGGREGGRERGVIKRWRGKERNGVEKRKWRKGGVEKRRGDEERS